MEERSPREKIVLVAGAVFFTLTYLVLFKSPLAADMKIQELVFSLRQDWLTAILVPFSFTGNWEIIVPICLVLLLCKKTRHTFGDPLSVSALLSTGVYLLTKSIIRRPRPDMLVQLTYASGFSFPSGHTQTSFVFAFMLVFLLNKYRKDDPLLKLWTFLIELWTFLIAFSRMYLGVHWPTDIIGGWCIALILICILKPILIDSDALKESKLVKKVFSLGKK